jgi:broad specificity phosphatase PhoE
MISPSLSRRSCFRLALLPLGSFGLVRADSEARSDNARTIILVRHGERITPNGDVALGEKGRERAKALAYMLKDTRLNAIYTSQMIRTIQTAEPLAEARQLKPEIIPVEKVDTLVDKLRQLKPGENALVVNHSGTMPSIVEKLGGEKVAGIGEDEFDRMLIVTLPASGPASVVTVRYGGR